MSVHACVCMCVCVCVFVYACLLLCVCVYVCVHACSWMKTAPEMFPSEEFPVTEVKVNTDVHFPGAGCLLVSCRIDPKTGKKE